MLTGRMAARVARDAGSWMSVVKMNVSSVTTIASTDERSLANRVVPSDRRLDLGRLSHRRSPR
jgi:hypothetical protein